MKTVVQLLIAILVLAASSVPAQAWPHAKKAKAPATSSVYDDYLARVRAMNPAAPATTGSLWVDSGPLSLMAADYKARRPGDLVIIHLVDNFTAGTSGESCDHNGQKQTSVGLPLHPCSP